MNKEIFESSKNPKKKVIFENKTNAPHSLNELKSELNEEVLKQMNNNANIISNTLSNTTPKSFNISDSFRNIIPGIFVRTAGGKNIFYNMEVVQGGFTVIYSLQRNGKVTNDNAYKRIFFSPVLGTPPFKNNPLLLPGEQMSLAIHDVLAQIMVFEESLKTDKDGNEDAPKVEELDSDKIVKNRETLAKSAETTSSNVSEDTHEESLLDPIKDFPQQVDDLIRTLEETYYIEELPSQSPEEERWVKLSNGSNSNECVMKISLVDRRAIFVDVIPTGKTKTPTTLGGPKVLSEMDEVLHLLKKILD